MPNEVDQQTVLNILGWEQLKQQRVKAKAIFKEFLSKNFQNGNIKPDTNDMKKGFMYDGASIWKSIPQYMRESKSISSLPLPFEIT